MGLTISNTLSLRQYYTNNRTLVTSSNRANATTGQLSMADATALRTAIKRLEDYDFEDSTDDDLQEKLNAFRDTYNYAIQSGTKYSNTDTAVKNAVKNMKNLSKKYADELEDYGITFDDSGYMKVSSSAASNISHERFADILGADSEYASKLYSYAKHITKHVNVQL